MPELNKPLLEKVMTHINDHPDVHDQEVWTVNPDYYDPSNIENCGTAACFAGWTCLLSGYTSRDVEVESKAVELLGIEWDDAGVLFHSDNTREDLNLMVKDLMNGEELDEVWEFGAGIYERNL